MWFLSQKRLQFCWGDQIKATQRTIQTTDNQADVTFFFFFRKISHSARTTYSFIRPTVETLDPRSIHLSAFSISTPKLLSASGAGGKEHTHMHTEPLLLADNLTPCFQTEWESSGETPSASLTSINQLDHLHSPLPPSCLLHQTSLFWLWIPGFRGLFSPSIEFYPLTLLLTLSK